MATYNIGQKVQISKKCLMRMFNSGFIKMGEMDFEKSLSYTSMILSSVVGISFIPFGIIEDIGKYFDGEIYYVIALQNDYGYCKAVLKNEEITPFKENKYV